MLDIILKNEFVVMAVDAILHLASVAVLAVIVLLACKLLTRGFVDTKLITCLIISVLLVIVRVFMLNNIGVWMPGVGGQLLMILVIISLYFSCFILVYKLVSIPALGTALSSAVIVAAQVALANYIPQLSLKLMPEGQRFAEYAGLANERTKSLMEDAKAYRGQSGGIRKILADAAAAINFFTSEDEQASLSRDFASGIALYKERKAYMDNMTPEELASYRRAMSAFLDEQGLAENRYSLSNLKNAKPEDLENLANFMKDMNEEYGFTDDLPKSGESEGGEPPPTAESLAKIAQSLSKVNLSGGEMSQLNSLFVDLGINADTVMAEMAKARDDLGDISELTSRMAGELKHLIPEGMEVPEMGDGMIDLANSGLLGRHGDENLDADSLITSSGYRIKKIPNAPSSIYVEERSDDEAPSIVSNEVSYFMPGAANAIPEHGFSDNSLDVELHLPVEKVENYYKPEVLAPMMAEQSIFLIPKNDEENARWREVSDGVQIDAWFASADSSGSSTIIVEGAGYKDGDLIERVQGNEVYRFRFDGIEGNQITMTALERVPSEENVAPVE